MPVPLFLLALKGLHIASGKGDDSLDPVLHLAITEVLEQLAKGLFDWFLTCDLHREEAVRERL